MDFSSLFGKKETPAETSRQANRDLRKAQRQVERTNYDLEREEKKLEMQIKQLAKQGQTQACKTLAKQLVQIRNQKARNMTANTKIGSIGTKAKMMQANDALANAMASSAGVMKQANEQISGEKLAEIMKNFSEENMKMDMVDEMMEESFNDILEHSDDEAESDMVVNKVLDEIGIEISGKLSKAKVPKNDEFDLDALLNESSRSKARASKEKH